MVIFHMTFIHVYNYVYVQVQDRKWEEGRAEN